LGRLLDNAKTFYDLFRSNKLTPQVDQKDAIRILEDIFKERIVSANGLALTDANRDGFMFFQGAYMGLLLMSKAYVHHLAATAQDQNLDPTGVPVGVPPTGKKLGNA